MIPDSNLGPLHVCAPMRTLTHMYIYAHPSPHAWGQKEREREVQLDDGRGGRAAGSLKPLHVYTEF